MMTLLLMCWSFFKTGLFAVGGGLATIPFLYEMSDRYGWFTHHDILNMLAVAESTPGPIGVNMATFCGFRIEGVGAGILATLALALPSVIVILIVARILEKFRQNRFVNEGFHFLRPASTALIAAAGLDVCLAVFFGVEGLSVDVLTHFAQSFSHVNWIAIIVFAAVIALMNVKKLKKLHPIVFIIACAVIGIVFKL